jgi:hypothetical protein
MIAPIILKYCFYPWQKEENQGIIIFHFSVNITEEGGRDCLPNGQMEWMTDMEFRFPGNSFENIHHPSRFGRNKMILDRWSIIWYN